MTFNKKIKNSYVIKRYIVKKTIISYVPGIAAHPAKSETGHLTSATVEKKGEKSGEKEHQRDEGISNIEQKQ